MIMLAMLLTGFQPALHALHHGQASSHPDCVDLDASHAGEGVDQIGQDAELIADPFPCSLCTTPVVTSFLDSPQPSTIPHLALFLQGISLSTDSPIERQNGALPPRGPPVCALS